jgi:hypothetical protein
MKHTKAENAEFERLKALGHPRPWTPVSLPKHHPQYWRNLPEGVARDTACLRLDEIATAKAKGE